MLQYINLGDYDKTTFSKSNYYLTKTCSRWESIIESMLFDEKIKKY